MKKISNKAGTICLWITAIVAFIVWMYFFYILVFEGANIAW